MLGSPFEEKYQRLRSQQTEHHEIRVFRDGCSSVHRAKFIEQVGRSRDGRRQFH